jgi:hypothetical protein
MIVHKEPELTITCLDYAKPIESRILLESIKRHVKFPVKVVFVDNGSNEDYSYQFLKEGLVDQLIVNKESLGLGLGTRDAVNAVFGPYYLMAQNDQLFGRDFTYQEFEHIKNLLESEHIMSVSLAGANCGPQVYSERGYIMKTQLYKFMEHRIPLGYAGAGKFHDAGDWREAQIQNFYKNNNLIHLTDYPQMVIDNGVFAVRDMGDGGVWCHRTDLKKLWQITSVKKLNSTYPKFSEEERKFVSVYGQWPDGRIPEQEKAHSFDCWSNTQLGRMEKEYIDNLRVRFKNK